MGDRAAKDGAKFLKLCSPAGAPPALYKWPLVNNVSGRATAKEKHSSTSTNRIGCSHEWKGRRL